MNEKSKETSKQKVTQRINGTKIGAFVCSVWMSTNFIERAKGHTCSFWLIARILRHQQQQNRLWSVTESQLCKRQLWGGKRLLF